MIHVPQVHAVAQIFYECYVRFQSPEYISNFPGFPVLNLVSIDPQLEESYRTLGARAAALA
jgi:hypothetical protein